MIIDIKKYRGYESDELIDLLMENKEDHRIVTTLLYFRAKAAEEVIKEQNFIDQFSKKYNELYDQIEQYEPSE